jgi:uncharacterized protein YhfF/lysophospholipase L1-like esterase
MMRFIFPIACVALAAVLIGLLVEPKAYRAIRHISGLSGPEEMDRDWSSMVSHHMRLDRTVREEDMLFIGDSHVQGMNMALLGAPVVNLGIGGDTSLGILRRLEHYKSVQRAKAVVLAFGLNDLNYRKVDAIARNTRSILDAISAPVVLSAVFPVDERKVRSRPEFRNAAINEINAALATECKAGCTFAPVPDALVGGGGNLKLHEGDGIHLSPAGYQVWARALQAALQESKLGRPKQPIDLFWQACLPSMDQPPADGFYRVRSIGGTPEITEAITKLILAGDKTGTFTSPWMFEGDREITPVVGGYSILTGSNNAPAAVLKTTLLMTLPFNQITENETAIDGPRVRPIDVWRPIHVTFFTNELEARGKTFVEDMPVTVEQFKVVCTNS